MSDDTIGEILPQPDRGPADLPIELDLLVARVLCDCAKKSLAMIMTS